MASIDPLPPEVKRMLRVYRQHALEVSDAEFAAWREAHIKDMQLLSTGYKFLKAAIGSGLDTAELEQNVARLQAKVDRQHAALTAYAALAAYEAARKAQRVERAHVIVAMLRRKLKFHAVRSPAIARIHRPSSSRARASHRKLSRTTAIASAGSGDPPPPPEPARLPGCVGATSAGTGAEVAA